MQAEDLLMNQAKTSVNCYAHGARYYDPQLARWHSPDPLSELYASSSPYAYVRNNPVNFIDPNGMYESVGPSADERSHIREGITYHTNWRWNPGRPRFYSGADAYFLQYQMQSDAAGGWRYQESSGGYINIFLEGLAWGANDFNQNIMPAFHDPSTTWYGTEAGSLYQWSTTSVGAQQLLVNGMNLGKNMSASDLYGMSLQASYRNGLMAEGDPTASKGGDDPSLILGPRGYDWGSSSKNVGAWGREIGSFLDLDGGVYAKDDPTNNIANFLIDITTNILPTGKFIRATHEIWYGTDSKTGQQLNNYNRYFVAPVEIGTSVLNMAGYSFPGTLIPFDYYYVPLDPYNY